jgi:hypothetical protein
LLSFGLLAMVFLTFRTPRASSLRVSAYEGPHASHA